MFLYTGIGLAVSAALFLAIHSLARPPPKTMTKEWQEATNEYLKVGILLSFQNGTLPTFLYVTAKF